MIIYKVSPAIIELLMRVQGIHYSIYQCDSIDASYNDVWWNVGVKMNVVDNIHLTC